MYIQHTRNREYGTALSVDNRMYARFLLSCALRVYEKTISCRAHLATQPHTLRTHSPNLAQSGSEKANIYIVVDALLF